MSQTGERIRRRPAIALVPAAIRRRQDTLFRAHGIARTPKTNSRRNRYLLSIEVNQVGKYVVRILACFGRHDWVLPAYFMASSFNRACMKLEQTVQALQRHEERLWFWGVERSDDPNLAGDLLKEFGLQLDRRTEFPRRAAALTVPLDRPVPVFLFGPVRRRLTEAVGTSRLAAAGD